MNHKKKDLERVAFGIAGMFGLYWLYSCLLKSYLPINDGLKTIIGLVVLYGVGLSCFLFITKPIETQKLIKGRVAFKTLLLCFFLQFSAIMIMSLLVNVLTAVGLEMPTAEMDMTSPYMLFLLLIFNPIIEEIVFRKLFADRLLKYGERFYMLVSSFCFAIVHGVSQGVPQIIYTFILGMVWSYLLVKTGNLKLVIILHAFSNLFGGVIMQTLLKTSMTAAGIYSILMMALGAVGLSVFMANRKKVFLDGEAGIFKREEWKEMLTNKGILCYAALTLLVMVLIE